MPTLILLRHAKSSWDDVELDDFDRPLAARGQRDAPRMGTLIAERGWTPDFALVSPAARTMETWDLVRRAIGREVPASFPQKLYLAGADAILDLVARTPEAVATLIVIGHNPGFAQCAAKLCGKGSDPKAADAVREKFPTAALARFKFAGPWSEIAAGTASLTDFVRPRDLG